MLVKSKHASTHVASLVECFAILHKNSISLNLAKCAFGVKAGKFLGFVVNQRGIEANPDKIPPWVLGSEVFGGAAVCEGEAG